MIKNKVVVITGASSGIGAELALLLAEEGASLVLAARRKDRLDKLAEKIRYAAGAQGKFVRALPVRCDVTVSKEAESMIEGAVGEYGRIDVLVNNAGFGHFASVEDTTDDMIKDVFAVNAFALWYTTRPALRVMKQQGSGHLINVASMAGKLGFPFNSAYVAAKHACVGFTHALRLELADTGIHASVVCPAGVSTDWADSTMGGSMLKMFSESGPAIKKIAEERNIPLPPIEGVIPPARVAHAILECIRTPVAEVYTHQGSREFALLSAKSREEAERQQIPVALGERTVYERIKDRGSSG